MLQIQGRRQWASESRNSWEEGGPGEESVGASESRAVKENKDGDKGTDLFVTRSAATHVVQDCRDKPGGNDYSYYLQCSSRGGVVPATQLTKGWLSLHLPWMQNLFKKYPDVGRVVGIGT